MRALVTGLCAGLATLALVARPDAQPAPDFAHAKELYDSAGTAMNEGRYADAAREYGAAYDITKDPVLFFKIGAANEKAGRCDTALVFYARYLREANPEPQYVELTKQRIAACGGDATAAGSDSGSAVGSAAGSAAETEAGSGSAAGSDTGAGSAVALTTTSPEKPARGRDAPWLLVGGALAFVTAGAVLAYSASSSEQDLKDLYVGIGGMTPTYDPKTAQRYHDLIDEGHRYQYMSWGSFAIAAGFGAAAAVLFLREHREHEDHVVVTPTASPTSAGVSATVRF